VSSDDGVQANSPVLESKLAPVGRLCAAMDTGPPSGSDAATVKVRDWPTLTGWNPGWLEMTGGPFSATLTNSVVPVFAPLASLVVRLTIKIPEAPYVCVAGLPLWSGEASP